MTARQVASLFIRLVAIYLLIRTIPSILSIGSSLAGLRNAGYSQVMPMVLGSLAGLILFLVLMALIIRKSDWFAIHLVKAEDAALSIGSLSTHDLQSIAFSWIGLLLITDGVTGLVYELSQLHRLSAMVGEQSVMVRYSDKIYSGITSDAAGIVIGLVLFLIPGGLAKVWQFLQSTRPLKS